MAEIIVEDMNLETEENQAINKSVFDLFKTVEKEAEFIEFARTELLAVKDGPDRQEFTENLKKWRRQRKARPENKTKDFPFPGSANVSVPLTRKQVRLISTKLIGNFSSKRQFWSGESSNIKDTLGFEAILKYMNAITKSPFHINIDAVNRKSFPELVSFGTQFYEIPWIYDAHTFLKQDETGKTIEVTRVAKDSPAVIPIEIEDFFTRAHWSDLQVAPWLAIRMYKTWPEMVRLAQNGFYMNLDKIAGGGMGEQPSFQEDKNELKGVKPEVAGAFDSTRVFEVYKTYAFFDANDDGKFEDIIVTWELATGTVLRVEPNALGYRPVVRVPFEEEINQLYGDGVCFNSELLQDETDTIHNIRIDGMKWSTQQLFAAKRGSSIKPNETIHPGKIIFEDVQGDFRQIQMADNTASTFQAEIIAQRYADDANGTNEPMTGQADSTLKSGGGSQAMMFQASQGTSTLETIFDTVEQYYAEIGRIILLQLAYHKDNLDLSLVTEEEAVLIQELLSAPIEDLPRKFKFKVETTDRARSEEVKKKNMMEFMQFYTIYAEKSMQYFGMLAQAQQMKNPQLLDLVSHILYGNTALARQFAESLKIGDPANFVPDPDQFKVFFAQEITGGTANGQNQQGAIGVQPGNGGMAGANGQPQAGMQPVPQGAPQPGAIPPM